MRPALTARRLKRHAVLVHIPPVTQARTLHNEGLFVRGLTGAVRMSIAAVALPIRVAAPVLMSRPLRPARDAVDTSLRVVIDTFASIIAEQLDSNHEIQTLVDIFVDRVLSDLTTEPAGVGPLVEVVAGDYLHTLETRPYLLDGLVRVAADRYVATLTTRPELLDGVVKGVAAGYIAYLQEHPELLDNLVQQVAGRYLEHLNENPAPVQELLSRQSVSVTTEIIREVRTQATVADNALEAIVRGLLRRKPRPELAPPTASPDRG